jgi:hypothetical protein
MARAATIMNSELNFLLVAIMHDMPQQRSHPALRLPNRNL